MPSADVLSDARAFAESVAGVLDRSPRPATAAGWAPGVAAAEAPWPALGADGALDELGWPELATDEELVTHAGLAAIALGRRLGSIHHIDRLLGGSVPAGDLLRCRLPATISVAGGAIVRRAVQEAVALASADGLDVHRIHTHGEAVAIDPAEHAAAYAAWLAAGVGYLAGVGEGALALTADYVRQRSAFGTTLAALGPVQQLLAGAATAVRGVALLAADAPGAPALAWAGAAVSDACAACHQVTGAIGYTLEHPLHRFSQRARALAAWNEASLDTLSGK